jgi:hypothetical protein
MVKRVDLLDAKENCLLQFLAVWPESSIPYGGPNPTLIGF